MIKLFADTADLKDVERLTSADGFTTNPTLFRAAGAKDYMAHAQSLLSAAGGRRVSIEVIADDPDEMLRQARRLAELCPQPFVKIPAVNTRGEYMTAVIEALVSEGVPVNVTAVFSLRQVATVAACLAPAERGRSIISVFAGRVADAGVDPHAHMRRCHYQMQSACPNSLLLWASPRQLLDFRLAQRSGCDIITMTPALISKISLLGKDLEEYSRETVQMFYDDARASEYQL